MTPSPASPEVSVVIPTRNRKQWLRECVNSVCSQKGVSWEVLIVDDASTDGTREWLREMNDLRVKTILLESQSLRAKAANRALSEARGKYVMFLDDDDRLRPGALRVLASALDSRPDCVASVGARWAWFTAEGYQRRDAHPRVPRVRYVFDEVLFGWSAVSGQNLYRTELVKKLGGYADGLSPCDDRDLWLRVAVHGKVVLRPEIVLTYRLHPEQWRPENIREIREQVARKAIRALPPAKRRYALLLRRGTHLLDQAEDDFKEGRLVLGFLYTARAFAAVPRIFLSPLIGEWTFRRLMGRIARRFFPPKIAP